MLIKNLTLILFLFLSSSLWAQSNDDRKTVRVFIFAGQSNMVGSDSNVEDIKRFPPYAGLEAPQKKELVLDTAGVLELGRVFAKGYLTQR